MRHADPSASFYTQCIVVRLRKKLKGARRNSSSPRSVSPDLLSPPTHHQAYSTASSPSAKVSPPDGYSPDYDRQSNGGVVSSRISLPHASLGLGKLSLDRPYLSESPELRSKFSTGRNDALSGLLHSGWNPDLPEPVVLDHWSVL